MILKTERIPVMFEKPLVSAIDDFMFATRTRTRAEAIRCLIRAGLEAKTGRETEKGTDAAA